VLPSITPRGRLARLTLLTWALAAFAVSALLVAGVLALSLVSAGTLADVWTFDVTARVPAVCAVVGLVLLTAAVAVALVTDELRAGIAVLAGRDTLTQDPVTVHAHHLLTNRRTASSSRPHRILPTALTELRPNALPHTSADSAVHVTVLVPAHNEEDIVSEALASLAAQTRTPDRVIVVADNCTDATADLARASGAEVFTTVANTTKKAGALNQALDILLPTLDEHDVVLVMDADTTLAPEFIAAASHSLEADPDLVAVGGIFHGEPGGGLVGALQRNEYTRYARYIGRRGGKVFVLSGTASMIRGYALSAVAQVRGELIPGTPGHVYDTAALTEDNELTLALKTLGAKLASPPHCTNVTEIMMTWRGLWRQRSRWQRGALENIASYGPTRPVGLYWAQQVGIGWGVVALNSFLAMTTVTLLAADQAMFTWFWVLIGSVFFVERVVTVWRAGWAGRLLAIPIFIELAYDLFLQAVFVKSIIDIATGREARWNSVTRTGAAATEVGADVAHQHPAAMHS
jgi:cellulose synthase/poly-beta-1,6-N-acetylglucosamine synthase-like glycosyltransferase